MNRHCLLLLFVLTAAQSASAQTVRGRVIEASGEPVATALLNLVNAAGATVRSGMSGAGGTFSISAPAAGRYSLRIERIGFASHTTEAFDLGAGETVTRTITVAAAPVVLDAVRAETSGRCVVRPQDGSTLARLFDAARSALGVSAHMETARTLNIAGVSYVRELDAAGRRQASVLERGDFRRLGVPFDAVPLSMLTRVGFAVDSDDGYTTYFGPSAQTLLSDQFLEQHCFRRVVDNRAEPGLVGLGFEPVRGNRQVGIAGTIWIERVGAAVRRIEYEYREAGSVSPDPARGYVEFARLADGRPFIANWWIRAPLLVRQPAGRRGEQIRVIGVRETGGIVRTVNGSPTGAGDDIVAQLDAAGDGDPRAAAALVPAADIARIHARGGTVVDALRLLGDVVHVDTGRYWTYDHVAADIVCVRAVGLPVSRDVEAAGAAGRDEFCDMIDVFVDGELIDSPGIELRRLGLGDVVSIEFLGTLAAARRLGEEPVAPVLLVTSRRGAQPRAAGASPPARRG